VEMYVREISKGDKIYDLGPKTLDFYSKLIAGAGTVFISGPCLLSSALSACKTRRPEWGSVCEYV